MKKQEYTFSQKKVTYYFNARFSLLRELSGTKNTIIITDEIVNDLYRDTFASFPVITFPAGEHNKVQASADHIIGELIRLGATRDSLLVGVGGGVVTDMTGFVAAIYMRGIAFALVPTSLLAMVDASVGGKNGIDVGVIKNVVGTIRQPEFILFDNTFLRTLPVAEWVNGFAEIIKHACIVDAVLFSMLQGFTLHEYQFDEMLVAELIERNVQLKTTIVVEDEFEKGQRKLLNFGHTLGHAIENLYHIPHGHAVSIGMVAACNLSEQMNGLHFEDAKKIIELLSKYQLPVDIETDFEKVFEVLKMDKKRIGDSIDLILLNKIGEAVIRSVPLNDIYHHLKKIL